MRSFAFFPGSRVCACLWQYSFAMKTVSRTGVTPGEQQVFRIFFIEPLQSFSTLMPNIFLAVKPIKPQTLAVPNPITLEKA
ncbi:hypothetical protein SAMN05216386_1841 [Nitrosospira briensis]|uniref:Uncharacterized protein n=1 Tax=Nitrosospira briensis TaxID=35799 RepID=A0A1I5BVT1_9PROT|nr:hypothetical protein SAMN05216386_1841 [Nitrosospira briensis]